MERMSAGSHLPASCMSGMSLMLYTSKLTRLSADESIFQPLQDLINQSKATDASSAAIAMCDAQVIVASESTSTEVGHKGKFE